MRAMGGLRIFAITVMSWVAFVSTTQAAYPGRNGGIAFFYSGQSDQPPRDFFGLSSVASRPFFHLDCSYPSSPSVVCPRGGGLAWSPSGRIVAFNSTDGDGRQVLGLVNSDNSGARRLPGMTAQDAQPTWAPAGDTLAFAGRSVTGARQNVYRVRTDGRDLRRLTGHGGDSPVWSVRQRIAFLRSGDIYVMYTNGSHQRRITRDGRIYRVDWSPDGRRIVYSRYGRPYRDAHGVYHIGRQEVHLIDGDGRHGHPIVGDGADAAFSPDGRQIVFLDECENVTTAETDGSHRRTHGNSLCGSGANPYDIGFPDWQPLLR